LTRRLPLFSQLFCIAFVGISQNSQLHWFVERVGRSAGFADRDTNTDVIRLGPYYLKKLETLFCLDRNIVLGVPSVQDRCAGCYSDGEGVCAKLCAFKLDVAIKRRDHNDLAFCILDSPNWFWFSLSFIFRPYHTQFQTLLA